MENIEHYVQQNNESERMMYNVSRDFDFQDKKKTIDPSLDSHTDFSTQQRKQGEYQQKNFNPQIPQIDNHEPCESFPLTPVKNLHNSHYDYDDRHPVIRTNYEYINMRT